MIRREPQTKHLQCTACGRKFSSYASLRRHYDEDHATAQRCTLCGKVLRPHESHYWGCP